MEKIRSTSDERELENDSLLKMLPIVLFGTRHLFGNEALNEKDRELAVELSKALAAIYSKPELEIADQSEAKVLSGLLAIQAWFGDLCASDETLPSMMATYDDGRTLATQTTLI